MKNLKNITVLFLLFSVQYTFSQKKDENIGSEVVNIVKPYSPTISDAFKEKEIPQMEETVETPKILVNYTINSFPVASTFVPAKGKAAEVDKPKKEKLFNNYATLGVGSFLNVNAELFITENISRTEYVGGMIRHFSSFQNLKDPLLDSTFSTTSADVSYGSREKHLQWNVDLGYQMQTSNWYGLPNPLLIDQTTVDGIEEKQNYSNLKFGGKIGLTDSFFKEASLQANYFTDAFSSKEMRVVALPKMAFEVIDKKINVDATIDYLSGSFERSYDFNQSFTYNSMNVGFSPSFLLQEDNYSVEIGASVFYGMYKLDTNSKNKIYFYPNVKASYKINPETLTAYAGAVGNLHQNSYSNFVSENPFVSPTLQIAPTNQKYDVFAGLNGKLTPKVSFDIKASFKDEEAKALFLSHFYNPISVTNTEGYAYGNAFDVLYDNVQTFSGYASIKADFTKYITFGVNATYNSYTTDSQKEAWNLPTTQLATTLDFVFGKKWTAGTKLFYTGERKNLNVLSFDPLYTDEVVALEGFLDANVYLGYKYNERISAFLKGNNLTSQDYQRWINLPVQTLQIMVGANYKFDLGR